jgi:hypothetical protein
MQALSNPTRRAFSCSATVRARRTHEEIRKSTTPPPLTEPNRERLKKMLARESERAFGPKISGDATSYVNKMADDTWSA